MAETQDKIYFISSDSYNSAKNSPHLEIFKKKDIEVLLLSDRIDEWVVSNLPEFEGKPLKSVTQGDIDLEGLSDEDKKSQDESNKEYAQLIEKIKTALGDKIEDIKISKRLTDSPACLIADEGSIDTNMENILKSMGQEVPKSKKILEINTGHPMLQQINKTEDEKTVKDWSEVLLGQSVLAEGGQLDNSAEFTKQLNSLLISLAN